MVCLQGVLLKTLNKKEKKSLFEGLVKVNKPWFIIEAEFYFKNKTQQKCTSKNISVHYYLYFEELKLLMLPLNCFLIITWVLIWQGFFSWIVKYPLWGCMKTHHSFMDAHKSCIRRDNAGCWIQHMPGTITQAARTPQTSQVKAHAGQRAALQATTLIFTTRHHQRFQVSRQEG